MADAAPPAGDGSDGTDGDAGDGTGGDGSADAGREAGTDTASGGILSRRTLIRLLVGLGIGIPIVIEGLTFLGLLEQSLFGDETRNGGAGTPTPAGRVGVGDELLPETPPVETVTGAEIRAGGGAWTLALTVAVENGTDAGYQLRLDTVTLDGGDRVEGGKATGRLDPGASVTITGEWDLPEGATPRSVEAVAITYPPDGSAEALTRRVPLAKVPVRGG